MQAIAPQCSSRIKPAGWAACQCFLLSRPSATETNCAMCITLDLLAGCGRVLWQPVGSFSGQIINVRCGGGYWTAGIGSGMQTTGGCGSTCTPHSRHGHYRVQKKTGKQKSAGHPAVANLLRRWPRRRTEKIHLKSLLYEARQFIPEVF